METTRRLSWRERWEEPIRKLTYWLFTGVALFTCVVVVLLVVTDKAVSESIQSGLLLCLLALAFTRIAGDYKKKS